MYVSYYTCVCVFFFGGEGIISTFDRGGHLPRRFTTILLLLLSLYI